MIHNSKQKGLGGALMLSGALGLTLCVAGSHEAFAQDRQDTILEVPGHGLTVEDTLAQFTNSLENKDEGGRGTVHIDIGLNSLMTYDTVSPSAATTSPSTESRLVQVDETPPRTSPRPPKRSKPRITSPVERTAPPSLNPAMLTDYRDASIQMHQWVLASAAAARRVDDLAAREGVARRALHLARIVLSDTIANGPTAPDDAEMLTSRMFAARAAMDTARLTATRAGEDLRIALQNEAKLIRMVEAAEDVVDATFRAMPGAFDLSPEALDELNAALGLGALTRSTNQGASVKLPSGALSMLTQASIVFLD